MDGRQVDRWMVRHRQGWLNRWKMDGGKEGRKDGRREELVGELKD